MKTKKWSKKITETSNSLILEKGVFTWKNPKEIALSLYNSALNSKKSKSTSPYKSAMSMLNFYINRAGINLSSERKKILNDVKIELKKINLTNKL